MTTRSAVALFTLLACFAGPAAAAPPDLVGERVRITTEGHDAPGSRLVGELLSVDPEGLVVKVGSTPRSVALRDVRRLEVRTGRRRRAVKEGMITGAVLLGAAGAVLGAAFAGIPCEHESGCSSGTSVGLTVGAIGAVIGTGLGGGVGALVKKDEWRKVQTARMNEGLSLQPVRRGIGVAYTVRF